jgi:peptide/nickel transport system substrate-binding protein
VELTIVRRWAAGLLAGCALAAACGGNAPAPGAAMGTASGGKSAIGPASAKENQINPIPRAQLQEGGKLTWPIDGMPANFNYNEIDGTEANGAFVIQALLPGPYNNDASGAPIWNPDLLASEPTLVTEPKQVVTYQINQKAAWYDGTPITWEDFYWQWKAGTGADKAYQIASSNGYEEIEQVAKGKSDREAVVTFKGKYSDWTAIFAPLYPASTNKDPKIFNEGWKTKPLTTAGPFKLQDINQTTKTITLVRNEKWWGKPARLESIVYRVIEADAQIDALANGEIDFMDVGPDANKFRRARGIESAEVRVAGGPNFRHITVNSASPVLQDVRVRRALATAIDRAAIARALLGPLEFPPTVLNNHIFMANQNGYQDNSGETGQYNQAKAGQLLDEAGWRLDGKVRKKDGRALELKFVIPTAVATSKQEGELIQNMLAQVGVTMNITAVPSDDFFDKYVRPGQFDLTVFSWLGTPYPISSSKSIYAKPQPGANGELQIRQNYARVGSDEIDGFFNAANRELDRAKAIALANQADALIWQEVHSLTSYQRPEVVACRKGLANFGAFGFASTIYEDIGWAKR